MRFRPNFHACSSRRVPALPPCDPSELRLSLVQALASVPRSNLSRVRDVLLSLGVSPDGVVERGSEHDPFSPGSERFGWMSVSQI